MKCPGFEPLVVQELPRDPADNKANHLTIFVVEQDVHWLVDGSPRYVIEMDE